MATETTILGLNPIVAAIAVTVIGITMRTIFGMAGKSRKDFDIIILLKSAAFGFFASLTLVATVFLNIPEGANQLTLLSIVTTQIGAVMGIDAAQHSLGKRVTQHIAKKKTMSGAEFDAHAASQMQVQDLKATEPLNPATDDVTPEEEGEDVPPGKSDA